MYWPHPYLRKATDRKEGDRTCLPVSGLKGLKVAEGHITYLWMLNIDCALEPSSTKAPAVKPSYWVRMHSLHTEPEKRKKKKQHLSRGSRVKTYSDICSGGHPIPARINVLPPFNFTWAGAKSKHSRRVITLLCLDQLVTGLWTPQKSAQGNCSPISLQIPLGNS